MIVGRRRGRAGRSGRASWARRAIAGGLVPLCVALTGCVDDGPGLGAMADVSDFYLLEDWSHNGYEATTLRFLPDGRALVITKGGFFGPGTGELVLLAPDGSEVRTLLEVPVCADAERGLLGLELSPTFESDGLIYLFYTRQMADCAITDPIDAPEDQRVYNRVVRLPFDDQGMSLDDEEILLDGLSALPSAHNAGDLDFLPDGTLLVSVGEAGLHHAGPLPIDAPEGKILRIDPEQPDVPLPDNPLAAPGETRGRAFVYASGFRNPWRFGVRDSDGTVVVADVGTDHWEELNILLPGRDYGYPLGEGPFGPPGAVEPALTYNHSSTCVSIIGGDFVPPTLVPGPPPDEDVFVYSDLYCDKIWAVATSVDPQTGMMSFTSRWLLGTAVDGPSDITVAPDGTPYLIGIGPGAKPISRLLRVK